ncbi:hypothetical protein ABN584_11525 [Gloeocapsa sp. BRSZ]
MDSRSAPRKCGDFQANNESVLDQPDRYSLDDLGTATNEPDKPSETAISPQQLQRLLADDARL